MKPMISDFIDGTLAENKAWDVQMHLSVCPECAQLARELQATVGLIKSTTPISLSSSFDDTLMTKIAQRTAHGEAANGSWLRSAWLTARTSFEGTAHATRRRFAMTAPIAFAGVAAVMLIAMVPQPTVTNSSLPQVSSDAGFAPAALHNNNTTMMAQPFADASAQALSERQNDDTLSQEGEDLLGSGKI